MTDDELRDKPREFWIEKLRMLMEHEGRQQYDAKDIYPPWATSQKDYWNWVVEIIPVIEKSAYLAVCAERDQLRAEVERLKAEIEEWKETAEIYKNMF